jgi:hypothetical protein
MKTLHIDTYHTSLERELALFDRCARSLGLKATTPLELEEWRRTVRAELAVITGIGRMESCPLEPRREESVPLKGYRREKWLIQTEPGVLMPLYVLIPDGIAPGERRSCVITPHGHGSGGKFAVAGRTDIPAMRETIRKHDYDYGVQLVREGHIVFCPDARGFGERREWMLQGDRPEQFLHSTCVPLNHVAISLGMSLTGWWTWDLMRLVDWITERPDCDPARIACAGLSGGGLQTLWLAAMDDRVRCAVVSGYFYGYRDSLLKLSSNCGCNYVPGLWMRVDMGDLGALIAPRLLLVETGTRDDLNGERGAVNATEQVEIARTAYRLLGAEDRLRHVLFDGPHKWHGVETPAFIRRMDA